jgi:galactonate dehydratase
MDYGDQALKVNAQGFTACKMDPFAHINYWYGENVSDNLSLSEDQKRVAISRLATVQSTVGQEFLIAVETHALLNGPTAMEMAQRIAAAGINCMWYEEPAGAEFPDEIAVIRQKIPLPVCVGERLHSRFMVRPILEKHAADILMPDITRCGGISELKKIATMCEAYNVPVAPHNPNGPISTIAAAHVMASVPNFFLQEFMFTDVPWRDSVLDKPLPVRNGFFELSDEPGLGFDLVEEELGKHPGITQRRAGFYI